MNMAYMPFLYINKYDALSRYQLLERKAFKASENAKQFGDGLRCE